MKTCAVAECVRAAKTRGYCGSHAEQIRKHGQVMTTKIRDHRGDTRHPEYGVWAKMRDRCNRVTDPRFVYYGARGIRICDSWNHSFRAFLADMGPRPSANHSLERKDNDGNYEPGNCRWVTKLEQANNKRNNVRIEYKGQSLTLGEWSRRTGILYDVLFKRIKRGWPLARVFGEPTRRRRPHSASDECAEAMRAGAAVAS